MEVRSRIPDATIERIALYARPLESLMDRGIKVISSEKFAEMCKINPAQIRKDLSNHKQIPMTKIPNNKPVYDYEE